MEDPVKGYLIKLYCIVLYWGDLLVRGGLIRAFTVFIFYETFSCDILIRSNVNNNLKYLST